MTGDRAEAPATLAWVAVVVAILDTIAVTVALAVALGTGIRLELTEQGAWINLAAGPMLPVVAALILRTRGRDPDRPPQVDRLAWLLLAVGVLCAATIALHVAAQVALDHAVSGAVGLAWISSWLWTGVAPGLLLVLLWFPTGAPPGRRWRLAVVGVAVAYAGMWLSAALQPGRMTDFPIRVDNPLGWSSGQPVLDVVSSVGFGSLGVVAIATVVSVVARFRRADPAQRAQLRWLLVALLVLSGTIALPSPGWLQPVAVAVNIAATFLLPVTLAVAVTRRDGYGLPRVLVYGLLSTLLLGGYLAIVAAADLALGAQADRLATLVAAAAIAVSVAPLKARLQRGVDRLVYGDRGDPYAALSVLGRRLAGSPEDLLHEVVAAVAAALRAPYVAVTLTGDDAPAAAAGRAREPQVVVPLVLRTEQVGALVVAQRAPGEAYGARDLALLDDLARHIAVAAHAAALTRDLQRSRESLVLAREEERRRIRRDLHDGLGPALAGVALGIDAARNTLDRDPAAVAVALSQLRGEVQSSIADVRRLVYDLRPPALDQLGLVPALEQHAARMSERGGITVTVVAEPLPALPAAVEVAAYRIATEALVNAARHSRGSRATVAVEASDADLTLAVLDDGVGVPPQRDPRRGIGLTAMAERAAELGGRLEIAAVASGGTAVRAWLPLRSALAPATS